MIFYHGTSTEYLDTILKKGILPRDKSSGKSNWEGDRESRRDLVYLSKCNPAKYMIQATDDDYEFVVLKVDVPEDKLYPDEDFLAYLKKESGDSDVNSSQINPRDYRRMTAPCIHHIGAAAIARVYPKWIVDHRIIAPKLMQYLDSGYDTFPPNYQSFGKLYFNIYNVIFENETVDDDVFEQILTLHDESYGFKPEDEVSKVYRHRHPESAPKTFMEYNERLTEWARKNGCLMNAEDLDF